MGAPVRAASTIKISVKKANAGLTRRPAPLISAPLARPILRLGRKGPCGGIGRRARLKIEFRKECWFDSGQGHHPISIHLKLLAFLT